MNKLVELNKSAALFNISKLEVLKEICLPLTCLNIDHFAYARFFGSDSYFTLMTNSDYQLQYFEKIDHQSNFVQNSIRKTLNSTKFNNLVFEFPCQKQNDKSDDILQLLNRHQINSLFAIYRLHSDKKTVECFNFCKFSVTDAGNFFMDNFDNILAFIDHFKIKAIDLISPKKNNMAYYLPQRNLERSQNDIITQSQFENNNFKKLLVRKRILQNSNGQDIFITPREYDVCKHASQGLTHKEIAYKLNISPRTTEEYFYNLREKLLASSKSEVIELFLKQKELKI